MPTTDLTDMLRSAPPGTFTHVGGGSGAGFYSPGAAAPGIFGSRPAPIPTPNPFGNLSGIYPNLSGTNAAVSSAIMDELQGRLSPAAIAAIQDAGATFGVTSGMPGSQLAVNRTARDLGLATEQLIQHGLGDYASLIPTISGTQTVNPALQTEIAATNAQNAAAPDPTAVENYAENLFNRYLQRAGGPAGGTGSFGGVPSGSASSTMPWYMQGTGFPGATGPFNASNPGPFNSLRYLTV